MNIPTGQHLLDELAQRQADGQTVRAWAEELGINVKTLYTRIHRTRNDPSWRPKGTPEEYIPPPPKRDPEYHELFQLLKSRAHSIGELSRRFDRSEDTVRKWLDQMEADGYILERSDTHAATAKTVRESIGNAIKLPIITDGHWIGFGVASDIHSGSAYCQPTSLNMFIRDAYDQGIRHIFVPGDVYAGLFGYRGQEHDLIPAARPRSRNDAYIATRAQIWLADQYIPRYDGLTYYLIGGNHDWWHVVNSGLDAVAMLCSEREDMVYLGYDVADVPLTENVALRMWHPTGGVPYALSYRLQKNIEQVAFEELSKMIDEGMPTKIRFLLAGHLHVEAKFQRGPMTASQVGCFEGQTSYLKRKGLFPSIGGQIWRIKLNDDGQIYRIGYDFIPYNERARDWENWPVPDQFEVVGEPDQVNMLYSLGETGGQDYAFGDYQWYGK